MLVCNAKWNISEQGFDPVHMRYYETVFTLGNGYLGTRGALEEDYRLRKPGTFIAGLFDQMKNEVTELPNSPDWLMVEMDLGGERFDLLTGKVLEYDRTLDLKQGLLTRTLRWESPSGRISKISFQRFVSLKDHHLMGLSVAVQPENYTGIIRMVSSLNGQVTNSGTQHFATVEQCTFDERGIYLLQETLQSGYLVIEAAEHNVCGQIEKEGVNTSQRQIHYYVNFRVERGETCHLEKLVTIYTTRDLEFLECPELSNGDKAALQEVLKEKTFSACQGALHRGFTENIKEHVAVWADRWEQADIVIEGTDFDQLAVRFAIFQLIQMTAWNDPRVSVAAKGLSGEGYRGHVFWDTEIFILPFFIYNFPQVAKNLVSYRALTLPGAMKKAQESGYKGAMYAWESADTGEETCPTIGGLDLKTRKPIPIKCGDLEHHISVDVPFAIWHYYQATRDVEFMCNYGAKILCLTARFWRSRMEYNASQGHYEINGVIGPDEYKENVNNNYYTNALVQWHLKKTVEVCGLLEGWGQYDALAAKIGLTEEEKADWLTVADQIKLARREDGLLIQHDGFLDLKEIDVEYYKSLPGGLPSHISWEDVNKSQVLKQADSVMLLYLLGDKFSHETKKVNWDFYEPRTMHDSSLSPAIHSILATEMCDLESAYRYFSKSARIDLGNNMGNSDHGLHAATQGGIWQAVVNGFAGMRVRDAVLTLAPDLPKEWKSLAFKLNYCGACLEMSITPASAEIRCLTPGPAPVQVQVYGETVSFAQAGESKIWVK